VIVWAAHGAEWALEEKVSFNGVTKRITVNEGVTALDIREDVYSAWIRWIEREDNARFRIAMRQTGFDVIPGGYTGASYFLTNGWKLEYDANIVAVTGVLYSDDYATPFWSSTDQPVYPATVSSLVNTALTTQNIISGDTASIVASVLAALNSTTIPVDLRKINNTTVVGTGTSGDSWRPQ
jgi:hypothetical protein